MNEEIRWLRNDLKVDELRDEMVKARQDFRKENPNASDDAEERNQIFCRTRVLHNCHKVCVVHLVFKFFFKIGTFI